MLKISRSCTLVENINNKQAYEIMLVQWQENKAHKEKKHRLF